MPSVFEKWKQDSLVWMPERGMGHFPVKDAKCEYFNEYRKLAQTEMGKAITQARIDLVESYIDNQMLVDIGIGSGDFIEKRKHLTFGYDIDRDAVAWLEKRGRYADVRSMIFPNATFWDSIEHLQCPEDILTGVKNCVFVSMPIFHDLDHLMGSKHLKKDEHRWYWTHNGFVSWMGEQGFKLFESNKMESRLGREDIETFVFRRR